MSPDGGRQSTKSNSAEFRPQLTPEQAERLVRICKQREQSKEPLVASDLDFLIELLATSRQPLL